MKTASKIITAFLTTALTYLLLTFLEWNYNFTEWHALSRLFILVSALYPFIPKEKFVKV